MKTLIPEKKDQSAKCQSMTLLALIFKSSMLIKVVKKKNSKTKIVVSFIYSSFTLISTSNQSNW